MKFPFLILIYLGFYGLSCGKDKEKSCWQAYDPSGGADVSGLVLCDVTKNQAEEKYPAYWFYSSGETKNCYRATTATSTVFYLPGIPASLKTTIENANGYTLNQIECNSFCNLRWIQRHQSKATGLFSSNINILETILSSDSCSKLFIGRIVVYRETPDSLITRELINKTP